MLKIRLMGTREDIAFFQRLVQNMPELREMSVSDVYSNSGTDRFFRCYIDIEKCVRGCDTCEGK
jgi:hypothetical protein